MLAKATVLAMIATSAQANVAQVHEHINDQNCLVNYIRKSAKACVQPATGKCFPHGTSHVNDCKETLQWQWWDNNYKTRQYAPGVLPPTHHVMRNEYSKWAKHTISGQEAAVLTLHKQHARADQRIC